MFRKWLAIGLALLASACADTRFLKQMAFDERYRGTDFGPTSRYLNDKESGKLYKYGNFCGPGVPLAEGNGRNLKAAAAIRPVDTLDRACKIHDLCYMRFGADSYGCDRIFANAVFQFFYNLNQPLFQQCQILEFELQMGANHKRTDNAAYNAASTTSLVLLSPMFAAAYAAQGNAVGDYGYPVMPGHCIADFGLANSYIGFDGFANSVRAGDDRPQLKVMQADAQRQNINGLKYTMVHLAGMLEFERRPEADCLGGPYCKGLYTGRDWNNMPMVDVERFLNTGEAVIMDRGVALSLLKQTPDFAPAAK